MRESAALDRLDVFERIGEGGAAETFRAHGESGTRRFDLALKILRTPPGEDPDAARRSFLDEARLGMLLAHPNLSTLVSFGVLDGQSYLAFERVDGLDAGAAVRAAGAFPVEGALHVVAEVLRGLEHAHAATAKDGTAIGIVHRDVTPSNVLLARDGAVRLSDFGIARALDRLASTATGRLKGNFLYMAPEQVVPRMGPTTARTDVYGAGMLLLFLLAGRHPLEDDELPNVVDRVIRGAIPRLSEVVADAPPALEALVATATSTIAEARFPDAASMRTAIERIASALPRFAKADLATRVASTWHAPEPLAEPTRRATRTASGELRSTRRRSP